MTKNPPRYIVARRIFGNFVPSRISGKFIAIIIIILKNQISSKAACAFLNGTKQIIQYRASPMYEKIIVPLCTKYSSALYKFSIIMGSAMYEKITIDPLRTNSYVAERLLFFVHSGTHNY